MDVSETVDKKISDLHDQGASLREIAREVGLSKSEVHRRLKRMENTPLETPEPTDSVPPPRELVRPPTSKPGPGAKVVLDEVATLQARESLESLERSKKLRERESQVELAEREAAVREKNIDSMKAEIELLATKAKLQGSAPEDRNKIAELETALRQAEKALQEERFKNELVALKTELRAEIQALQRPTTGKTEFDLISEIGGQIVAGIHSELSGIRQGVGRLIEKANNISPASSGKGPITPEEAARIAAEMSQRLDGGNQADRKFYCTCSKPLPIPPFMLSAKLTDLGHLMIACDNPFCNARHRADVVLFPEEFQVEPPPQPDDH